MRGTSENKEQITKRIITQFSMLSKWFSFWSPSEGKTKMLASKCVHTDSTEANMRCISSWAARTYPDFTFCSCTPLLTSWHQFACISTFCFIESWPNQGTPDAVFYLMGYQLFRTDWNNMAGCMEVAFTLTTAGALISPKFEYSVPQTWNPFFNSLLNSLLIWFTSFH